MKGKFQVADPIGNHSDPDPGGDYPDMDPGGNYPDMDPGGNYPDVDPGGKYPDVDPGGNYPDSDVTKRENSGSDCHEKPDQEPTYSIKFTMNICLLNNIHRRQYN